MKKRILITCIVLVVTQHAQANLFTTPYHAIAWQEVSRSSTQLTIDSITLKNKPRTIQWDNVANTLEPGHKAQLHYPTSAYAEVDIQKFYKDKNAGGEPAAKKNYQSQVRIPEPSSLGLMLLGALGIVIIRRKNHD